MPLGGAPIGAVPLGGAPAAAAASVVGTMVLVRQPQQPSVENGFAQSGAESFFPGLWEGLYAAWGISIGQNGDEEVRDYVHNPDTLTSSDALKQSIDLTHYQLSENYGWFINLNGTTQYLHPFSALTTVPTAYRPNKGSVAAWVRTRAVAADNNTIIAYGGDSGPIPAGIFRVLFKNTGAGYWVRVEHAADGGTLNTLDTAVGSLPTGGFHHIVVTSDGSKYRCYIDGREAALSVTAGSDNGAWLGTATATSPTVMLLGESYRAGVNEGFKLDGWLGDVLLYDRALSQSEALALAVGSNPFVGYAYSYATVAGGDTAVGQDLQLLWDVYAPVNQDLVLQWDLDALTGRSLQLMWDVESSTQILLPQAVDLTPGLLKPVPRRLPPCVRITCCPKNPFEYKVER